MKTTIKLNGQMFDWARVEPLADGVRIVAGPAPTQSDSVSLLLTPDQASVMIFALEQALEAAGISRDQAVLA